MIEPKSWYKSTTIWIGILTVLAGIVPLFADLVKTLNIDPVVAASVGAILATVLGIIQVVRRYLLENPPAPIK